MSDVTIELLSPDHHRVVATELAEILRACVAAGASVNFIHPFPSASAEAYWTDKVVPAVTGGKRWIWGAWVDGRLLGTVQLDTDLPPNQPHRGEVTKLLVHPDGRRRGIARALMMEMERVAVARGKTLLTLDTRSGDHAEPLYTALGFITVGRIPGFSIDAVTGEPDATTYMYKPIG